MTSHEVYIWTYDSWIFDFPQTISKIVDAAHKYDQVILKLSEGPALEHLTYLDTKLIDILKKLCLDNSWTLDKFSFITANPLQDINVWPYIKYQCSLSFFLHGQSLKYSPGKKNIQHHFGCFVNGSNWNRLWLSAYLFENFKEITLQTFRRNPNNPGHAINLDLDRLCFEFASKNKNSKENFFTLANFLHNIPIEIHTDSKLLATEHFTWPESMNTEFLSWYDKIFVDIVCETMTTGRTFQLTEKIARPILTQNPFIIFGPANFLKNFKSLGFKSFYKFWDESYDDFAGVMRINAIEILIEKIAKCSKIELKEMYNKMIPTLEHNHSVYNSITEKNIVEKISNIIND